MSRTDLQPTNRRWVVIGGVLIALFSALVIALGVYLNQDKVRWTLVSYQVVDDQTVTVTFDVHRPADAPVVCRVRGIGNDFAVVGATDVSIPAEKADGAKTVREEVSVRTTTRANTGTVFNCVVEGKRSA